MKNPIRKTHCATFRRNILAQSLAFAFGTTLAGGALAVAPAVSSFSPTVGSTTLLPSSDLTLNFDQSVTAIIGKSFNIYKSDATLVESIPANDTGRVTVAVTMFGSAGSVTINPTANLALGTGYYVQIDPGAFQNAGVEDYVGIADTTTWNFTTVAAATVTDYSPANGATNFVENANLSLTFSENVTAVTGKSVNIFKSDGTLVETIVANNTAKVTVSGSSVTINPAANLPAGSYYVQIDVGAFTGNTSSASYAGITDATTWAFTSVADTAAPTTYNFTPTDNATGVSPTGNLSFSFNESVTPVAGKSIKIYKADSTLFETIAADDTSKVTLSTSKFGPTVSVNPTNDLAFNTGYYVQIDPGTFVDTATTPNAYAGISDATTWNFTTAAGAAVSSYSPTNGATNFVENASLSLTFGESVTAVSGKAIRIYKSDNTLVDTIAVTETTKITVSGSSVTIKPSANLGAGSYYVQIDSGAFTGNASGGSYAGIADSTTWAFSAVADTTAPTASFSPADNASNVALVSSLYVYFGEKIAAVAGKYINIKKASDNSTVASILANDTSKVTVSDNVASINHGLIFAANSGYYVQIDPGAFVDTATTPNAYAGISDTTTWNFTTAAGATVSSYSPTNGATNFVENANLYLYFGESVTAVAGKTIAIYKSDNTLVDTIVVTDTSKVTVSGAMVSIKPTANLTGGSYYVQIDVGAFTGNTSSASYAGITDTTTWAFTSVADTAAPTATISTPADNATGVAPSSNLTFYFNEKVTAAAGKDIRIYKSDGTLVDTIAANDTSKVTVSGSKSSITINPASDLAFNTGYYVQIDPGAFVDAATTPNAYAGISDTTTWNFTTAAGGAVSSYSPTNGAANFLENADLQLVFSEGVTPVAGKNILIRRASDNSLVEAIAANDVWSPSNLTAKVSISPSSPSGGGVTVIINPTANLTAGSYYVTIDAGAFTGNTSGTSYAGIADTTTWAFTAIADNGAPTVSSTYPSTSATDAVPSYGMYIGFNEKVTAVAGKSIFIKKTSDDSVVASIPANDTTKVTVSGSGVSINPGAPLAFGTGYYIQIEAGAFVDTATTPNAYAGIANSTTWAFTTAAGAAAVAYSPANNATNFVESADLSLTFSESVTAVAGKNIAIKKASDNSLVENISVTDTTKVKVTGSSVTINPANSLPAGGYYVNIDAGAFTGNTSGSSYAGIANNTTWAFTTVADTTAPSVATGWVAPLTPANNAVSISPATNLVINFSENVAPAAGKNIVVKKISDDSIVATIAANDTSKVTLSSSKYGMASVATINTGTTLGYSADYYVNIDAGAFTDTATTPNSYAGISSATTWKFTTTADPTPIPSPTPAPSYTPPPPPTTTTVAPGGTTTISTTTTPVDAGAGSTLNVTEGTSGATINLPTPPATGTTTPSAVNVVIGGNTLSVKPTESGSVVKTATVSINGANATVLNVTAGTAQVTASAANQPLVSVGTGANAVVISSGSASATVITSVDKTTGVTSLTLPKSTTVSDADASVKMTIGGQDVNVKPQGGADVVVTLATVTVNGVSTQVVSVTGGSAMVTSSQPNQPLLAIGSGSSAIVVTGGSVGSEATSRVDSVTGNTTLSITSGTITLPSNAFAEAGNGFAAIKDGKLYAGEIAVFNSAGKITGVRLGSQSGSAANVGDPITAASAAGLTRKVAVPNLKGKVARVSDSQDFTDVIAVSLGATSKGQNSQGVLSLNVSGVNVNAMPIGEITVDTSRADGMTATGNGKVEVAKSGVIASFVPAVTDPALLTGQAIALDKNAGVTVNEYGVLQASLNGITYALQPGWVVSQANGGTAGFTMDAQGRFIYQDGTGNQQTLYPAFADLAQLVAAFKGSDANLSATGNDDGTVTAKLLGKTYTLTPDYALIPVPAEHAKDAWWLDSSGKVYVKNGDGKTAQGFGVK